MKDVTKAADIQSSLLSAIILQVEALPDFAKLRKFDEDLLKLTELEAAKKSQERDIDSRLADLRKKLTVIASENLEEISRERVRLTAEKSEVAGLLSDLDERRASIVKEKLLVQHAFSEQARAVVEKFHKQEIQEVRELVAIIESRLLAWRNTADQGSIKYFPRLPAESSIYLRNISFFAPTVRDSCSMSSV